MGMPGLRVACTMGMMVALAQAQPARPGQVDWPFYGGDQGGTKFSTLTDINTRNVAQLQPAWTWKTGETELPQYGSKPGMFEVTPLMIDNVIYLSTPYNKVVALKADSGKLLWSFNPRAYELGQPANGTGWVHR